MGIEELMDMVVEHFTLDDLHHYGFFLEDLMDGIEPFITKNRSGLMEMLEEGGHLG